MPLVVAHIPDISASEGAIFAVVVIALFFGVPIMAEALRRKKRKVASIICASVSAVLGAIVLFAGLGWLSIFLGAVPLLFSLFIIASAAVMRGRREAAIQPPVPTRGNGT